MKTKTAKKKPESRHVDLPPGVSGVMSIRQIARALDVTPRQAARLIASGEFPRSESPAGHDPRWRVSTFNQWVEATYGNRS